MIRLSEVSIRFKRWLIRNGEIDIPSGRVTLIKGLSGTGKTTLLYRIGLISKDQYYKYRWNKTNVNSLSYNQRNEVRRNHIGYVFQDFCLFDDFSVYENIEYYSRVASIHINEQKVKELLKSVWLEDVIFQPTYTLSGGEKQRLAIACALVKDPELLVLDEPTSALDEENERNVFSILRTLAYEKGKTVVVASHSYIADDYADCIYTIDDQKIVCQKYEESQEEIKTHSSKHELSFVPYYLKQYFKKHSFMNILMVFIILGGCLCSIYIQGIIQQTLNDVDDKINKFSDHQIAIFNKNVDINVLYNGTDISQSIIDRLSKNDHVRSIYPMYNLTVEVGSRQYPVFPLFDENRLEGKLFSKTLDERHAYLSYLLHYENPEKNKVSRFIFNNEIEVEEDVDVSGVLSIGKKSEFSGNLSYVMMDYDEIERIAKANHIKPTKCAYVLFMKDIESVREVENIVNEYRLIRINTFQNALELLNMKNNTILTMKSEKTFVKILTVLLFLYLGYWNIKGREKEFVLLYINGISLKELVGIMMSDLLMKLCIAFALSIGIGYILSMIHILEMNFIELINYFIVIGSIVGISMFMMTCYFVKKLDPERILRN